MDSDTELQEDEEDILVYVEFEGFVNNNIFRNGELQLDIIGIDTDHPIMQIDGKFYEGTYEDAVGTYMFFDKDDQPVIHDPVFDQAPTLKYFGKTRKILKMQRVFVKQRVEVLGDSEHSKCIPNIDTIKEAGIPPMYQSEALSFWKDIRDKRIDALCAYLKKHKIREEMKSQGIALDSESDEDNPFAIYKDKEVKSQQNLVNSNTKSSVDVTNSSTSQKASPKEVKEHIHSKPSTSKTSDPIADMDHKVCRPTKLVNRKKVCVKSKTTKKQKKKSKVVEDESIKNNDCNTESIPSMEEQSLNNSTSDTEVNNLLDNIENYIINNFDMKSNVQENKDINTDINTIETQVKTTDTILDIVENTKDKKHDKLSKREAKLKALLGKLKSDKECDKMNTNISDKEK